MLAHAAVIRGPQSAEQDTVVLYCLMGKALCRIQLLEDALSHSIALKHDVKKFSALPREKADERVKEYRSYVLGKAVNFAKEKRLYGDTLQNNLKSFLAERNWLVHKCIPYHLDDMLLPSAKDKLYKRLQNISDTAQRLQQFIEADMLEFSEAAGKDMSAVRAALLHYFRDV